MRDKKNSCMATSRLVRLDGVAGLEYVSTQAAPAITSIMCLCVTVLLIGKGYYHIGVRGCLWHHRIHQHDV